jgi:hypothetical protein
MNQTYQNFMRQNLSEEARRLMSEALEDQDKMDILEILLDEEVANTASAPGIAMVSNGEPVSPKYRQKEFGKGVWRRKKKTEPIFEAAQKKPTKPAKKAKPFTGHLEHVGDMIYHGNPSEALRHMTAMHQRFKGKHTKGHEPSLKVDGGMSVVVGREHDGTHFVKSKHGQVEHVFKTPEDVHATGKEHYVKHLVPLLHHVKTMNIKPGHAFQADLVHHETDGENQTTAKPNTITYKVKSGKKLTLAAHSQYALPKPGAKA